jgi:hypothetical protein
MEKRMNLLQTKQACQELYNNAKHLEELRELLRVRTETIATRDYAILDLTKQLQEAREHSANCMPVGTSVIFCEGEVEAVEIHQKLRLVGLEHVRVGIAYDKSTKACPANVVHAIDAMMQNGPSTKITHDDVRNALGLGDEKPVEITVPKSLRPKVYRSMSSTNAFNSEEHLENYINCLKVNLNFLHKHIVKAGYKISPTPLSWGVEVDAINSLHKHIKIAVEGLNRKGITVLTPQGSVVETCKKEEEPTVTIKREVATANSHNLSFLRRLGFCN